MDLAWESSMISTRSTPLPALPSTEGKVLPWMLTPIKDFCQLLPVIKVDWVLRVGVAQVPSKEEDLIETFLELRPPGLLYRISLFSHLASQHSRTRRESWRIQKPKIPKLNQ
jgi:hypothetical protein